MAFRGYSDSELDNARVVFMHAALTEQTPNDDTEILELAIVDTNGELLFHELIKPDYVRRWPWATKRYGIAWDNVAESKALSEYASQLEEILSGPKDTLVLPIGWGITNALRVLYRAGIATHLRSWYDLLPYYADLAGLNVSYQGRGDTIPNSPWSEVGWYRNIFSYDHWGERSAKGLTATFGRDGTLNELVSGEPIDVKVFLEAYDRKSSDNILTELGEIQAAFPRFQDELMLQNKKRGDEQPTIPPDGDCGRIAQYGSSSNTESVNLAKNEDTVISPDENGEEEDDTYTPREPPYTCSDYMRFFACGSVLILFVLFAFILLSLIGSCTVAAVSQPS